MTWLTALPKIIALVYAGILEYFRIREREAGRQEAVDANLAAQEKAAAIAKAAKDQAAADHAAGKIDDEFQRD